MSKKIKLVLGASSTSKRETVDVLSDLGFSDKMWEKLSEEEKQKELIAFVNELPEQPYWELESHEEI